MLKLIYRECSECGASDRASENASTLCKSCGGELQRVDGRKPTSAEARVPRMEAIARRNTCKQCEHYGSFTRNGIEYQGCGLLPKPCKVDRLRMNPDWNGPDGRDCFTDSGVPDHLPTLAAPYVTTQRLCQDALLLASKISRWKIRRIVGVPRSGMIAASILATRLNVPLWGIYDGKLQPLQSGLRARDWKESDDGWTVVVEDSSASGWSINEIKTQLNSESSTCYVAVYATPSATRSLRAWGRILPLPHWFEWNLWGNDKLIDGFRIATDMDGVLCDDCPIEDDDDGDRYGAFLRGVKPLVLPTKHPVHAIITARLEKYRKQTEAWLAKHRMQYKQLIMGPWASKQERERSCIGSWKLEKVVECNAGMFVESDPVQAEIVSRGVDIPVICPAAQRATVRGVGYILEGF